MQEYIIVFFFHIHLNRGMTILVIMTIGRGCFQREVYSNLFFYLPDFRGSSDVARAHEQVMVVFLLSLKKEKKKNSTRRHSRARAGRGSCTRMGDV